MRFALRIFVCVSVHARALCVIPNGETGRRWRADMYNVALVQRIVPSTSRERLCCMGVANMYCHQAAFSRGARRDEADCVHRSAVCAGGRARVPTSGLSQHRGACWARRQQAARLARRAVGWSVGARERGARCGPASSRGRGGAIVRCRVVACWPFRALAAPPRATRASLDPVASLLLALARARAYTALGSCAGRPAVAGRGGVAPGRWRAGARGQVHRQHHGGDGAGCVRARLVTVLRARRGGLCGGASYRPSRS